MRTVLAVAALALVACDESKARPKDCPDVGASAVPAAPPPTTATPTLGAKNECVVLDGVIALHAIIPTRHAPNEAGAAAAESRTLYSLSCSAPQGEALRLGATCTGEWLDVSEIEKTGQIGILNIGTVSAQLRAKTATTATMQIGTHTTFTIDTVKGTVAYAESGHDGEVRGEAACYAGLR